MKKNIVLKLLSIAGLTLLLSGCGTVSALKLKTLDATLLKGHYDNVVVEQFSANATKTDVDQAKITWVRGRFSDLIVEEMRQTNVFKEVSKDKEPNEETLLIGGDITSYIEGDVFMRSFIGFGAGSSYFKSLVQFRDGKTKNEIGTIEVDNNSYVLGGYLAAGQTPEAFMRGAAKKIASEAKKLAK